MRKPRYFSPAEWELLQYILEHHPITVREVAAQFAETHGHARTTVLTMMERLREKGYLTRRKVNGVNRYSPSESKPDLLQGLVRDFVQKALGGSVSPFVAYLGKEAQLNRTELNELKQLVQEWEAQEGEAKE
jgi:BlaI family transcriptional regulator, penicillinase repressor